MFTGIIEDLARVIQIDKEGNNVHLTLESSIQKELKVDQSVSHNGVCLTVTELIDPNKYKVTAIKETLDKSNLSQLNVNDQVNLERCMIFNGRIDGHIVQGHVDQIGEITQIENENGSWKYRIKYDDKSGNLTVEKGSICVNGVSLTVIDSDKDSFSVAIIPYTHGHTTFKHFVMGSRVNLEFDILGKYLKKYLENKV